MKYNPKRISHDLAIMRLLREAYKEASKSPDPSTRNGALLVRSGQIALRACNDFPTGVENLQSRLYDRKIKSYYVEHAERAVLHKALRDHYTVENKTMVCPWAACADCARAILTAGIQVLYVHKEAMELESSRWNESIEAGLTILEEGGIPVVAYEGRIGGGVSSLRNGEIWQP